MDLFFELFTSSRNAPRDQFYNLRHDNHAERNREQFEPQVEGEGGGAEERAGVLDDQNLNYERAAGNGEHQVVFEKVFDDAVSLQFAAVKRVEQLEQREHCKKYRTHLIRAYI